ncbi:glycoside hydrolase family 3 protein [Paenibacillus glycanilyticus]|uniref:glycoside hydrolase family 3 protein n=1 Tax=Paenibacillus glycanilyticus TaxID=126569 RepID=UPI00203F1BD8|nr:glycoside hydrolase family 3 protein [Paenibacillus glycanilyticus]MCM3629033.1 glycoside hydrolase family 3 protein [Paenibacillus glycanilyticus]
MGELNWSSWTLREKVGQLFVFGFHGYEPTGEITSLIENYGIGGTIYFGRNVRNAEQVHQLSSSLKEIAHKAGRPNVLVAIDQEGGMVARIVEGVTLIPGNMALGATGSAEGARETARVCGEELRLLGVTMNYAPCLDVNNNPDNPVINVRSYGDRSQLVGELGKAALLGYQASKVAATVKHFPGHGDTSVDSHHALPVLPHSRERLDAIELAPFRAAIAAGTAAIMTAHVCLPALDPSGKPSTLSQPVLTGLLREELGYKGVIVTDCLEMDAIDQFYGPAKGAVLALQAGADMVLVSHTYEKQVAALEAVVAAVESGELSEERIHESLARVMQLKRDYEVDAPLPAWEEAEPKMATPASKAVARQWSEASATLVKNDGPLLPLRREARTLVLWPDIKPVSVADEMLTGDGTLGDHLKIRLDQVEERLMSGTDPLAGLEAFEQIVVVTYDATKHPIEREIANHVVKLAGDRTVAVSVRNPLDLKVYPAAKAYLAVYECRPLALESAAKVLTGELKPTGSLPLELSAQYPFGWNVTL